MGRGGGGGGRRRIGKGRFYEADCVFKGRLQNSLTLPQPECGLSYVGKWLLGPDRK